jgi:hypothetical protein
MVKEIHIIYAFFLFSLIYIYMIGGSRVVTGLLLKTRAAFNCETIEREKKGGSFYICKQELVALKGI